MEPNGTFRVSQVENLTGVGVHTLRAWERRYGVPRPPRSEGRQRRYTSEDIELVRRMKELSERGSSLSESADIALRELRQRRTSDTPEQAWELILERLTSYDERGASSLWLAGTEGRSVADSLERIAVPILVETGTRWERGELSIASEHYISNFLRGRLDQLYRAYESQAGGERAVLLACLPGERHEMGLFMLAIMLRCDGVPTTFLGADLPTMSLVESVDALDPTVVVLYAAVEEYAGALQGAIVSVNLAGRGHVVYGGQAFDHAHHTDIHGGIYGGPSLSGASSLIADLHRRSTRERTKS